MINQNTEVLTRGKKYFDSIKTATAIFVVRKLTIHFEEESSERETVRQTERERKRETVAGIDSQTERGP